MTKFKERLARGYYSIDYSLLNISRQPELPELLDWLRFDEPRLTGWPPFVVLNNEPYRPKVVDKHTYRATIIADGLSRPHVERWMASTLGNFTIVRAHDLDTRADYAERHVIALTTPVWRVGEIMLHAERMARRFGAKEIDFTIKFTGLKGRKIVSLPESNRFLLHDYETHAEEYEKRMTLDVESVDAGVAAFTDQLMRPFYSMFEFVLPAELCEQEISKMRSHRF